MSKPMTIKKGILPREYTRYNVRLAIKRYIKYKEKDLGRVCRKIFTKENPEGTLYMYANFCKNYDKLIVTIAYSEDGVGWIPMEIGKDINLLPSIRKINVFTLNRGDKND